MDLMAEEKSPNQPTNNQNPLIVFLTFIIVIGLLALAFFFGLKYRQTPGEVMPTPTPEITSMPSPQPTPTPEESNVTPTSSQPSATATPTLRATPTPTPTIMLSPTITIRNIGPTEPI